MLTQEELQQRKELFRPIELPAMELYEDAPRYPIAQIVEMIELSHIIQDIGSGDFDAQIARFVELRDHMQPLPNAPERIYLWPKGKMPQQTVYTDNSALRYNHGPDFQPYFFEILLPEDATPKGAVITCSGGDHGAATFYEAYQTCLDFVERGYQTFLLMNRTNGIPWSRQEAGVDTARLIRILRKNAAKYRIQPNQIAFAGFSNGGCTGENCIRYFSGQQTVQDSFPDYIPDEYDAYPGGPDALLFIYSARNLQEYFDYSKVIYPPTFLAYGRCDPLLGELVAHYNELVSHGVTCEVHSFTGAPHGQAGIKILKNGISPYPSFEHWIPLADYFMQDVYQQA